MLFNDPNTDKAATWIAQASSHNALWLHIPSPGRFHPAHALDPVNTLDIDINHATLHQLSSLKGFYIASFEFSEK